MIGRRKRTFVFHFLLIFVVYMVACGRHGGMASAGAKFPSNPIFHFFTDYCLSRAQCGTAGSFGLSRRGRFGLAAWRRRSRRRRPITTSTPHSSRRWHFPSDVESLVSLEFVAAALVRSCGDLCTLVVPYSSLYGLDALHVEGKLVLRIALAGPVPSSRWPLLQRVQKVGELSSSCDSSHLLEFVESRFCGVNAMSQP